MDTLIKKQRNKRTITDIFRGMTSYQTEAAYREFWQENMIARMYRNRRRFMLIVYLEGKGGQMERVLIHDNLVRIIFFGLAAVLVAVGVKFHSVVQTAKVQEQLYLSREDELSYLKQLNDNLSLENISLENKNSVLTETVHQKLSAEKEKQAAEQEDHIPKGLPVDGQAGIEEKTDENGNPLVEFSLGAETGVISTGSGKALKVEEDPLYGVMVQVDHGDGYISIYRFSGNPAIAEGDEISRGVRLFTTSTENALLGYQLIQDGTYINPVEVMDISG